MEAGAKNIRSHAARVGLYATINKILREQNLKLQLKADRLLASSGVLKLLLD